MKNVKLLSLAITVLLFIGCSTIHVVYDYDVEADFSKYRTFRWANQSENTGQDIFENPLMDKRLKHAIKLELQNKGFEFGGQNADFTLAYEQTSQMREDVYVTKYYPTWRHFGIGLTHVSKDKSMEGMIILKIYDTASGELIWQGWATGIEVVVEYIGDIINETAESLVENFPPSGK